MLSNLQRAGFSFVVSLIATAALAQPVNPTYFGSLPDAVTGDNQFPSGGERFWDVDPAADVYQLERYERPTIQTFATVNGRYATRQYFEYVDITRASVGFDSQYLYINIDVFGRRELQSNGSEQTEGLKNAFYGFQISTQAGGRGGMYFYVDQPETSGNGTTYGLLKGFGFRDLNNDVSGTGLTVTKQDNGAGEAGNGFEREIVADGKLSGTNTAVFFSRIRPTDNTVVEFALDYAAVGLTQSNLLNLGYLNMDVVKGGPKGPALYLFNDEYNKNEAGSPNPGAGGLSEFGTQGLGNIYEMDNLPGGQSVIPEPAVIFAAVSLLPLLRRR